jgi:putative membrane protein insertion efficiency factor
MLMTRFILRLPRRFVRLLIRGYQKTLSPDHGYASRFFRRPTCKFHPSCSEYGHQAIGKYGVIKGGAMSIWRILRCNPWSKGGHDPVR